MSAPSPASSACQPPLPERVLSAGPKNWLLLRGLGREQAHWFDFPQQLRETLGATAECLDLCGAGTEWKRQCPTTIEETARDLAGRFRHQFGTPQQPWGLLGLSLGAMVGLSLCQLFPTWFSHLVTVNASSALSPLYHRLQPPAALQTLRIASLRSVHQRERAIYRLTSTRPERSAQSFVRQAAEIQALRPVRRWTVARQLTAAARFHPSALIPQRVLLLSSANDQLVNPKCSTKLAAFLRAPVYRHSTGGHDLPLDDPYWVLRRIQRWIEVTERAAKRSPRY